MKTPGLKMLAFRALLSVAILSFTASLFAANGTIEYFDANGTTSGFGSPISGAYNMTNNPPNDWSTDPTGVTAPGNFSSSDQMTFGSAANAVTGTFSVNLNSGGNLNGICVSNSGANVTLTGNANTHATSSSTWVVVAGSTLTVTNTRQGFSGSVNGFNWNNQAVTFQGDGTMTFRTPFAANTATALQTENMSGGILNLQIGAVTNTTTYGGGFSLVAGTFNFASAGSANAFNNFTNNPFIIRGGTIDNTSGSPLTLNVGGNADPAGIGSKGISVGGSFTFTGTTNLNFGTAGVVISNSTPTITVNNNTLTIGGVISNAPSTTFGLTKAGSGTLALGGTNTYSGATTVNAGELDGITGGSSVSAITAAGGATNGVQVAAINGQWNPTTLTFNSGSYVDFNFSSFAPGTNAPMQVGTINFAGTPGVVIKCKTLLQMGTYPLVKYTTLTGTSPTTVTTFPTSPGTPYAGYVSNDVATSTIYLVVTGGPTGIFWTGYDGSSLNSSWDTTTLNWAVSGSPVNYADGSILFFTDSASNSVATLQQSVNPVSMTVSNNTLNYTINDNNSGYAITGTGGLSKQGSGSLTLDNLGGMSVSGGVTIGSGTLQIGNNDGNGGLGTSSVVNNGTLVFSRTNTSLVVSNVISGSGSISNIAPGTVTLSGANTFTGVVNIAFGTLKLGNNSALGATNNGTIIASGAALDLNAKDIGQEPVTVQGVGVLNNDGSTNGAIYSSGGTINQAITRVTLTGDTVFGAPPNQPAVSNRWDIRSSTTSDANGASLSTGSHAYSITKVGNNQISIVGVTVDPNLADIDVKQGLLSIEVATTGLGDPSRTLTVRNGATLQFYQMTNLANKNIVLEGGATIISGSGNNTVIGPMVLTNNNAPVIFNAAGASALTLSNVISGIGSLTKNNTNTLTLAGPVKSYSGGTTINDGTFILNSISSDSGNVLTENTTQTGSPIPVVVGGNGTNIGPVDIENILHPGASGHPSTFGVGSGTGNEYPGWDGALVFGANSGGGSVIFDLSSSAAAIGGGVNDLITINGDLDGNIANVEINPLGALDTSTPYTLITYTGVKNGGFNSTVNLLSGTSRYGLTLNYPAGAVTLTVSGGPALLQWNNNANNGLWDVQISQNWFNMGTSLNDKFYNYDSVVLDDSITGAINPLTTLTIPSGVAVSPTLVTNNSTVNYTITGAGKISGAASIVKLGSSTLTLNTTNDFTGSLVVLGGAVRLPATNSAGKGTIAATNGAVIVGTALTNPIILNNAVLGDAGTPSLSGDLTIADSTTSIVQTADPQNSATSVDLPLTGTLHGSGTIIVMGATSVPSPDGGQGFRLRGTNTSDFTGTIILSNSAKGEIQTTVAGPFTPAGAGKFVLDGGTYAADGTANGTYSEFNLRNNATGDTFFGNNVELSGSGLAMLNVIGSAPTNAISWMGSLKIGDGQALGVFVATTNSHTAAFQSVTLTGGNATFVPKPAGFGTVATGDLLLSNVTETVASSVTMAGLRTLTLAGISTYTGNTIVTNGTLLVSGFLNGGGTLTNAAGSVVGGNGTNAGPVNVSGQLSPGGAGSGTFGAGNGLTLNTGGTVVFDLNCTNVTVGGGVNDLIQVNGNLNLNNNSITVNWGAGTAQTGTYVLANYTGSLSGTFSPTVAVVSANGSHGLGTLDYTTPHQIKLTIAPTAGNLIWNSTSSGAWDVAASVNWFNTISSVNDVFLQSDSVTFDDSTPNVQTNVTIGAGAAVSPVVMTNNSSVNNYTISGAGKITGGAFLVKLGGSTLTLTTTNDFTNGVLIAGGTVAVQNSFSLGATNTGAVIITNSATLDLSSTLVANSINFGVKPFIVSGTGVGGNGAIVNNGTNQQNAFQNVTLGGNAAFGGSQRFDIRASGGTAGPATATLSTSGHAYKLTKTGTNFIAIVSTTVDPALGDIDLTAGTLDYEGNTTGLGNSANTLTVFTNATLFFYNSSNALTKKIVVNDGGIINNNSGANIIAGQITLNTNASGGSGNALFGIGGLSLTVNGVIGGAGTLIKSNASPLTLNANDNYTGSTLINAGTLALGTSGAISASANIVLAAGTTLDASGRSDLTLTLNNGQTLAGIGNVIGKMTGNIGSTLSPAGKGSIGTLTVSSAVVLKGTSYMETTSGTFDQLTCGSVTYGGTLIVSNLSVTPFTTNNTFKFFNAGTYSGAFTNIAPATPNNDLSLAWDTNSLTVSGTLKIVSIVTGPPPTPRITGVTLNGATLHVTATNGANGGQFMLLSSTNVALPLSQWQTNVIGTFDGSGNLNLSTNIINANDGQRFYILKQ